MMEDSGIESDDKLMWLQNNEVAFSFDALPNDFILDQSEQPRTTSSGPAADDSLRANESIASAKVNHINTCKVLQRKLEMRVEQAKKNYCRLQDGADPESRSSKLIPIDRLPIPHHRSEHQPLVEYNSEANSDEEHFFPVKLKPSKKLDVNADTFSIQEMSICSGSDSEEDAQNLELRFSTPNDGWLAKVKSMLCC